VTGLICAPRLIGLIYVLASAASGADGPLVALSVRNQPPHAQPDFRIDSDLVLIPVSVTDARNHAVTGLGREAFRVFEDRTEQKVVHFSCDDAPVSVGIIFDSSESMTGKLQQSREAIRRFLEFANPQDEFFLVEFSTRPRLTVPFTGDTGAIQERLLYAQPKGTTSLLDAVGLAVDYLKHSRYPRRALLILSDGGENHSRYTETEMLERVRESDLWIYAMGIYEPRVGFHSNHPTDGQKLLETLAEASGGRQFAAVSLVDLPLIAARISLELRNEYVLGYHPANSIRDGKYHHIRVSVAADRDLTVSWRPGYYGPEE